MSDEVSEHLNFITKEEFWQEILSMITEEKINTLDDLEKVAGGVGCDLTKRSKALILAGLKALGPMAVDSAAKPTSPKQSFYINTSDSIAMTVIGVALVLGIVSGSASTGMIVSRFKNAEPVTLSCDDIRRFSNVECLNRDRVSEDVSQLEKRALLENLHVSFLDIVKLI